MTNRSALPARSVVERLRHSEERFRLLVESVQDYALYILDPAGRVASWNIGAERIKGYRAEEVIGRHFSLFYTKADIGLGKPETALASAAANGHFEAEAWRVRKDGTLFWAAVVISAMRDGSGKLRGFAKVTRDLTERKRAAQLIEESNARLCAFMQHSPLPMFVKDVNGRYERVNPAYCDLLGLAPERILGLNDVELFGPDSAAVPRTGRTSRDAAAGRGDAEEVVKVQIGAQAATLHRFPIHDDDGRKIASGGVITELRAPHSGADTDRSGVLAPPSNSARSADSKQVRKDDVAVAGIEVDQLAIMVARDLRPLLRNIETLTSRVRDGMADVNATARQLEMIAQATTRLNSLHNDICKYSHSARSGPPRGHSVDLNAVVAEAREAISQVAGSRTIRWDVGRLPPVKGDQVMLRVAFEQLLSNAIKFSRRRDPALIRVRASSISDDEVTINISDNGVGYPDQLAYKLFGALQRLQGENEYEGAGLGLIMAKRVIECHGGRIWAESHEGAGASFFFTLCRAPLPLPE